MKNIVVFMLSFALAPLIANAQQTRDSGKYINKRPISHLNSSHPKQIDTEKLYIHTNRLNQNYPIKKIFTHVEGIDFKGNFDNITQKYLNRTISNQDILNLSSEITKYFNEQDYLLPIITINEEDLKKEVLNISVHITTLKDVIIIGESNNLIQDYALQILKSKPTRIKSTQRYIALMNKVPGFSVKYKLRGDLWDKQNIDNPSVDLVITTQKTKGEIFTNLDNYGVNNLGKAQASLDTQINSAFMDSDSLSLMALTSNHPDRLYDIGMKYGIALNNLGTRTYLTASHSEYNSIKNIPVSSKNNQQNSFSLITTHPLYLTASQDLEIQVGTHYKTLKNYELLNSSSVAQTEYSKYWSIDLGIEYLFKDKFSGYNIIKTRFNQGINGNFSNYQDPSNIADKNFNLFKFDFYRQQPLINNFSIFAHFAAYYSDNKLPTQELFVLGGREFGRGYSFAALDGNKMLALSLEARYTIDLKQKVIEQIQPYIFIDTGYVGKQSSDTNINKLSSAGTGLRFKLYNDVDLNTEIAQSFTRSYIVDKNKEKAGTKLNIFINKIFKF